MNKDKKLIIIGSSGHGKVIADIASKNGYEDIRFLDDNETISSCGEYKVVGSCKDILKYKDFDFVIAIGDAIIRRKIQEELLDKELNVVSLIHPNAVVASTAKMERGTVVMAGAIINPYAEIGQGCIINTSSSVDHDCHIGNFVHVSVGSHLAGSVTVGDNTWIGAGATVSNNVIITKDCMVGAGAVVIKDLEESSIYIGVPARKIGEEYSK